MRELYAEWHLDLATGERKRREAEQLRAESKEQRERMLELADAKLSDTEKMREAAEYRTESGYVAVGYRQPSTITTNSLCTR